MQTKSTLILLILVVLTGGYILLFERTPREEAVYRELDTRAIRFSPETLTSVRLKTDDLEFECERADGKWALAYPVMARVSSEQLDRWVTALAALKRHDSVGVDGRGDIEKYGFDQPRASLTISDNQGTKTWLIGRDAPLGEMVYVMDEGGREAAVTDSRIMNFIPGSIEDIRERSIFPRSMAAANRIDIRREAGFLQLGADTAGDWRIQQPTVSAAQNAEVSKLLEELLELRIEKFVADEVTDMTSYGLQDPQAQIMLASGEDTGVGLLIGNPVPDSPGLVYAKQTEEYAIFAISTNALKLLQVNADQLRDRRLLPMEITRVRSVSVQQAGNGRLTLNQTAEGKWELTEPRRWSADPLKVAMFMNIWHAAQADQFLVVDEEGEDPRGELAMIVTFMGESEAEKCVLTMYYPKTDGASALCSREGEDGLFSCNKELLTLADLNALDYKNTDVLSVLPENVSKITQVAGTNTTVLVQNEAGEFADADPVSLKKFWAVLRDLKALAYAKESPESLAEFGLDVPHGRVTLSLKDSDEIGRVLLIGDTCPGGRYAMLQGSDIVFIMKGDEAEALCTSLKNKAAEKSDEQ